ncbi:MAG: sigma-70 family RNA polymerase sigma factor [Bacilli bacterium]|nr:sigma-70 family RNA polymerase sigma factor [Bacilli bacterium]
MIYNNIFAGYEVKTLNNQELLECFKEVLKGNNEARNMIIASNIKLVMNRVFKKFPKTPYEIEELISLGLIGLMKAVDNFDLSKGYTFSTYASKCVDNEILMFIRKGKRHLKNDSLNRPLQNSTDGTITLEDTIMDDASDFTLDFDNQELYEEIKKQVELLEGREKEVVKLYFGFSNNTKYKGTEIAEKLNISQPYVSRIIRQTLVKIKNNLLELGLMEENNSKLMLKK